jgi:hypothetical protein
MTGAIVGKTFPTKVKQAVADGRLSKNAGEAITTAWKTFRKTISGSNL